jgi:hypothetical protein
MAVAKRFEELICWQVAVELRDLVCRMIEQGPVLKDSRFRDQIRDSACSAPRNMAEGFGRFDPPEFARFLNFARLAFRDPGPPDTRPRSEVLHAGRLHGCLATCVSRASREQPAAQVLAPLRPQETVHTAANQAEP